MSYTIFQGELEVCVLECYIYLSKTSPGPAAGSMTTPAAEAMRVVCQADNPNT